jgi:hypothetical protein
MESQREANDEGGWIQGLNVDIAVILFFDYSLSSRPSAFNYAWAEKLSRGVRARPVGSSTRYNIYTLYIEQSRTLTRGVRIMYMHDRAT